MAEYFYPLIAPVPDSSDEVSLVTPDPPKTSADPLETGDYDILTCNTDHSAAALARLLCQYDDAARLKIVVGIFVDQIQELEDAMWALISARSKDVAVDQFLDDAGALVGEDRNGLTDDLYRKFICSRIAANASDGSNPDIAGAIRETLESPTYDLKITELYPSWLCMEVSGTGLGATFPIVKFFQIINDARAAGFRFILKYARQDDANVFQFAPSSVEIVDAAKGFSNVALSTGGYFAGAIADQV